jgi:hypothetical protein
VIEFKRDVYQMALTELARFCRAARSTTATCARASAASSRRAGEPSAGRRCFVGRAGDVSRASDAGLPTAPADLL